MRRFVDRYDAGRRLATLLATQIGENALVLALPRGGVPVGFEVARILELELDVFVVRKLGVPGQEELAAGALASGGLRVFNDDVLSALNLRPENLEAIVQREATEVTRRERLYRGGRRPPRIKGREIVLVDDGMATGATMRAGVRALRRESPARIVVAVPVAAPEAIETLRADADDVVSVVTPPWIEGVGQWYEDFAQTPDTEVRALLDAAWDPHARLD